MLYDIEIQTPTPAFAGCWSSAGHHLQNHGQGALYWLKCDLLPPFLEHLSFRIGNQLVFVRLEDTNGELEIPGNPSGTEIIARRCNGIACRMPMRFINSSWQPEYPDWGLIDFHSGTLITPVSLISNENILMTDWEIHDVAVQLVRSHVQDKLGRKILSSQGNPDVDPSIWFKGLNGPEWILVRASRTPESIVQLPDSLTEITNYYSHMADKGYFASVNIASAQALDGRHDVSFTRDLWRGYKMAAFCNGLRTITLD
tara:strand:- start:938 stop:1708 length:771 start_codon:yes stop_codon:yes gene_type:complete